MAGNDLKHQVPVGVRDILPAEAKRKRDLENTFCRIFRSWGYDEVVTPTYEYYDALAVGQDDDDIMYKFLDRQGRIMALRPDMTTPIARLVATRMADEELPLRLFYLANVFGYEDPQTGRQREFYQAGVELIGSERPEADGEVIAIAIEALSTAGLQNFQLCLGQIEVFNGLMEELDLSENKKKKIRSAINNKDFVELEELLDTPSLPREDRVRILKLLGLRGGKDIIAEAGSLTKNVRALGALDNLAEVFGVLEAYEVADKVCVDLGLLRGFDYYTGIVFEGYTPAIGFPICGGGRYDGLLGRFGSPKAATGFALGIERLLIALEKQKDSVPDYIDYYITYNAGKREAAFAKARELRSQGYRVEVELSAREAGNSAGKPAGKSIKNHIAIE